MGASNGSEPSLGMLVAQATEDVQSLVRNQIELTKLELSQSVKKAVGSSGLLIGAGTLGFLGFIFLLVTAAYGLIQLGLAPWLAFLIVTLVLFILAAVLGLVGKKRLEGITGPERSVAALEETRNVIASHLHATQGEPAVQGHTAR